MHGSCETGAELQVALPSASPALTRDQCAGFLGTSDDALHLAIKLAVDEGNYERAAVLLDVLPRARHGGSVQRSLAGRHEHSCRSRETD